MAGERTPKPFKLFIYGRDEDAEVLEAVLAAGIDCEVIGTSSEELAEDHPVLQVGGPFVKFIGINEIEEYLKKGAEGESGRNE